MRRSADAGIDAPLPAGLDHAGLAQLVRSTSAAPRATSARRVQITKDMWISAFRVACADGHAPRGRDDRSERRDVPATISCTRQTPARSTARWSTRAGVNTDDLAFPDGVAVHLAAGST